MLFRQLLDPETSTWTYLLGDEESRRALIIDPVLEKLERDRTLLHELELELAYVLETHVHADHVTASGRLREACGARIVVGSRTGVGNADVYAEDGLPIRLDGIELEVRHTPGHTAGCVTYVCHAAGLAFTGDALLIRGCGRTDFQEGSAPTLFRSVRGRIFSLPDATRLHPGHDYEGRTITTVAEEKRWNARLALSRSEAEFVAIMDALDLAQPRRIDIAVPANLTSGLELPESASLDRPVERAMAEVGREDAVLSLGAGI